MLVIYLIVGLISGLIGASVAGAKGKNSAAWGVICFFLPIALLFLFMSKDEAPAATVAGLADWDTLVKYDPDLRSAYEQVAPLGPDAIRMLHDIYSKVQNKAALPSIVADIVKSAQTSHLLPIGFSLVESVNGMSVGQRGKEYWAGGQIFTSLSTAKAYAKALAKRQA